MKRRPTPGLGHDVAWCSGIVGEFVPEFGDEDAQVVGVVLMGRAPDFTQ
jgi:hypothetical protein